MRLREVVRYLLDHLREWLRVEDFPDQERGPQFAVEEAESTVWLPAILFVTQQDSCEMSVTWIPGRGEGEGRTHAYLRSQ